MLDERSDDDEIYGDVACGDDPYANASFPEVGYFMLLISCSAGNETQLQVLHLAYHVSIEVSVRNTMTLSGMHTPRHTKIYCAKTFLHGHPKHNPLPTAR